MRHYSVNIQKGGAMLTECRKLLAAWQPGEGRAEFAQRVMRENLLGKRSRSRLWDVLTFVFFRRFPAQVADNLHRLLGSGLPEQDLALLLLYHTALADDLLFDFVTQHLYGLHRAGRLFLDTQDGVTFIRGLVEQGLTRSPWSDEVVRRTSRGLLAACRDFGVLEGYRRKKFAHPHVSESVFLYVAYDLKDRVGAPGHLVAHTDWKLFLMDEQDVERNLLLAHQAGALRYQAAGGIRRLDWTWDNVNEFVRHVSEGAH